MSLGLLFRVAGAAALTASLAIGPAGGQQPVIDPGVDALLSLTRSSALAVHAADAAVSAASASARASVLPNPFSIGVAAEGIPSGVRLDRAGQLLASADWTLWRGKSAAALQQAADARATVYPAWRGIVVAAAEGRARVELARFAAAVLRQQRLDAEATLLIEAEGALSNRVSAGDARYLDVLRMRTARLQVAAEISQEAADAAAARTALLLSVPAGAARDSISGLLNALSHEQALTTLASFDPADPGEDVSVLIAAIRAANQATITARRRSRDPSVDAMLGVERFGAIGEGWSVGPAIGVRLNLPMPGGTAGARIAQAAEAEALAIDAELLTRASLAVTASEAGRGAAAAARERLRLLSSALLDGAPAERATAVTAFTAGRLSLLELLDFERALSRITLERIDAVADAATAAATARLGALEPYLTLDLLLGVAP